MRSLDWTLSVFGGTDTVWTNMQEGQAGLLAIYPKGKGTGKPVRSFNAIITSFQETIPFDGAVELEIGGIRNGAMTSDVGDTQA
jgi:hypothetical protein